MNDTGARTWDLVDDEMNSGDAWKSAGSAGSVTWADGTLHLVDDEGGKGYRAVVREGFVPPTCAFTFEFTARMNGSQDPGTVGFSVRSGDYNVKFFLDYGTEGAVSDGSDEEAAVDTTVFHVYRVVVHDDYTYDLYVDGTLAWDHASNDENGSAALKIGTSGAPVGDVTVDSVRVANGELVPAPPALTPTETSVTAGDAATFTVSEDGVDVTKQWAFKTDDPAATVDGSSILFRTAGTHTVTATRDGSDPLEASVTVAAGAASSLTATPSATSAQAGDKVSLTVTAADAFGNDIGDVTSKAVVSSDRSSDRIDGASVKLTEPGTSTFTVSLGAAATTVQIKVTPGPAADLRLELSKTAVEQGGKIEFTVSTVDAFGNTVADVTEDATVTSDHSDDVVDGDTVTFPHASSHVLTAEYETFSASATVAVHPAGASIDPTEPGADGSGPTGSGPAERAGGHGDDGELAESGSNVLGSVPLFLALLTVGAAFILIRRRRTRA